MKNKLSLFGMKSLTQLFVLLLCFVTFPSHAIETITYYHTDSLGSPVAGTDANGALLWKEDYKPYGERIRKQVESEKNTRWYTGHPEDKETGLTYAGARFYDSVTGRFLAIDPVGFNGSINMFNRYAYANNNPYKYLDPDGRIAETALDVISLGLSINAFNSDPSLINGLGLGYDGLATLVPFLPAGFGILKNVGNGIDAAGGVTKTTLGKTKSGAPRIKQEFPDGRKTDITDDRVKEFVPNAHPKAPPGKMNRVKFDNAQPGSKGFKRDPTPDEIKMLDDAR